MMFCPLKAFEPNPLNNFFEARWNRSAIFMTGHGLK